MAEPQSIFAAGQRYVRLDGTAWRPDDQLTILVVSTDPHGTVWITYSGPDGEVRTGLASHLEPAISAGRVVPVASGPLALC
jgi:hypothetical protein